MIQNLTKLQVKTGERSYEFLCAHTSPLGEVYDALSQMRSYIFKVIQEQQKEEEKASE